MVLWLFGFVWMFWLRVFLLIVFFALGLLPRWDGMNERNFYYIGIAFFGMINGIFNPYFFFVFQVSVYLMAEPLFGSTAAIAYFSSLMLSTATVILGGIPAALYERYHRREGRFDRRPRCGSGLPGQPS